MDQFKISEAKDSHPLQIQRFFKQKDKTWQDDNTFFLFFAVFQTNKDCCIESMCKKERLDGMDYKR